MRLYTELADHWHALSAPDDYREEAQIFRAALEATAPGARTVLELGCGGGNNATHLKAHYDLTLVDRSHQMLAQSRRVNPECEHIQGDMRTFRLGRLFDAVFVHDAVMYLTSEADVAATMRTAFEHTTPGGVALFVPDDTRESWREEVSSGGSGSIRYLQWNFDPDPADTSFVAAYALLVRGVDGSTEVVYDRHDLGLFSRATWTRLIEEAGFEARTMPYQHSSFDPEAGRELFLGIRRRVT